jgi:hypothetical protein
MRRIVAAAATAKTAKSVVRETYPDLFIGLLEQTLLRG